MGSDTKKKKTNQVSRNGLDFGFLSEVGLLKPWLNNPLNFCKDQSTVKFYPAKREGKTHCKTLVLAIVCDGFRLS